MAAGTPALPAVAQGAAGKIAFESSEATGTSAGSRSRIGVMNADGTNATNLTDTTNSKFDDWNPSFNRSGSKIVFMSDRTGNDGVYVMNADGTNQVRLTKSSSLAIAQPRFSPDGTKIVFFAIPINVANATWEIYLMNADGSGQVKLTTSTPGTGGVTGATFTPDGKKILFEGPFNSQFGVQLCEMNLDGSGLTVITTINAGSYSSPSISPDGSKIVLSANGAILLMNADGTGQKVIYNTGFSGSPVFNLDGTKIAFGTGDGNTEQVFTMNLDGTGLVQITFGSEISPPSSIEANDPGSWAPGTVGLPILVSLSLSPSMVLPGNPSQGAVSLSKAAPVGGALVSLTSDSPFATVPASIVVPAGATSASFPISTVSVSSATSAVITAMFDGVSQAATLKIDPAQQTSTVTITKAEYTVSQKQLQVQATSTSATDTMNVFVTSTGVFIGTMTNVGGGKYQLQIALATNPLNVTVISSLGGSASLNVNPK